MVNVNQIDMTIAVIEYMCISRIHLKESSVDSKIWLEPKSVLCLRTKSLRNFTKYDDTDTQWCIKWWNIFTCCVIETKSPMNVWMVLLHIIQKIRHHFTFIEIIRTILRCSFILSVFRSSYLFVEMPLSFVIVVIYRWSPVFREPYMWTKNKGYQNKLWCYVFSILNVFFNFLVSKLTVSLTKRRANIWNWQKSDSVAHTKRKNWQHERRLNIWNHFHDKISNLFPCGLCMFYTRQRSHTFAHIVKYLIDFPSILKLTFYLCHCLNCHNTKNELNLPKHIRHKSRWFKI